jgi:hypothetical protein
VCNRRRFNDESTTIRAGQALVRLGGDRGAEPPDQRSDQPLALLEQPLVLHPASQALRQSREHTGPERDRRERHHQQIGVELLVDPSALLGVSVQGSILNLLRSLQSELGFGLLFISHNISLIRYVSDTIAVMYQGRIVETGPPEQVIGSPANAYTRELLATVREAASST